MSVYHNISQYLEAKWQYENIHWKVTDEGIFGFVNGEWISWEHFKAHN